jgi:small subunit ribosomal protein S16
MLTIRLTRKGKKNQPFFRIVVVDKRKSSKGGRSIEDLGYKNPLTKKVSINKERVLYWIKNGAQLSNTIYNLLVEEKIIEGKKIHVSKISKKKQSEIDKAKVDAENAKKVEEVKEVKTEATVETPVSIEEKPA